MKKILLGAVMMAFAFSPVAAFAGNTYTRANLHPGHEYLTRLPQGVPPRDVVINERYCYFYVKDGRAYPLKDLYNNQICKPRGNRGSGRTTHSSGSSDSGGGYDY